MREFDKIIGYKDIKIELKRFCDVLKNPDKYEKVGVKPPVGVMLYGEPGLGKTLMAQCFIKESGRKTFTIRKDKPDGDFYKINIDGTEIIVNINDEVKICGKWVSVRDLVKGENYGY